MPAIALVGTVQPPAVYTPGSGGGPRRLATAKKKRRKKKPQPAGQVPISGALVLQSHLARITARGRSRQSQAFYEDELLAAIVLLS